jgi:type I restriction enzyme, S subunit
MVREGYKETELGEIPEEWDVLLFRKAVKFAQYGLSSPNSKIGLIPIIGMSQLQNGKIDYKNVPFTTTPPIECEKYFLQINDLLFNRTNSAEWVGKTALVEGSFKCVFASYIVRFQFFKEFICPKYIAYFMGLPKTKIVIKNMATPGVSQYNINPTNLKNLLFVPIPSLPEQHRIATVISTLDECIEKTEALIAKLRSVKAGLMQDLLTKGIDNEGRIRDESTHEFKDTEIGRVPVEWDVYKIGDVLIDKIINGYSGVETTPDRGIPTLTLSAVTNNCISKKYTKSCEANPKNVTELWIKKDDIFIGRSNTYDLVGLSAITETNDSFAIFSDLLIRIRINHLSAIPKYVSYFLRSDKARQFFMKSAKGTSGSMKKIDQQIIKNLKISIPPLTEQKRIMNILISSEDRISQEEKYRDNLFSLKKGLMVDLLTGQIRVKDCI